MSGSNSVEQAQADLKADLRTRMRGLASRYAAELPALDAHSLMLGEAMQGVELHFLPMGERDGAYDPERNIILINSQSTPERQRFTLAHEISHALLFTDDDLLSDLHDHFEGDTLEQTIETLCNVGASALLIGDGLLSDLTGRFGYTGRTLAELVKRANVSGSVALFALAEQAKAAEATVLLAVCSAARKGDTALLVRLFVGVGTHYSLRAGTVIPPEHPVSAAMQTGLPFQGESYVPFRSGRKMPAWVDAFPEAGRQRVFVSFEPRQ